jgi:ATPase subunit of ABC transporter with duplicated ATPase domains
MELIRFTDLERHYGARTIFAGLSGAIRDGEKIGLVGSNGAGKSSLVRLLTGLDELDGGSVVRPSHTRFAYLAQDSSERGPATLRLAFEGAIAQHFAEEWETRATLNRFGFADEELERPFDQFSGGQLTRALLARTLLENPDWLVLDEPTNHLDIDTTRWLENFVVRDARAYLIVSHDRYFLETIASTIWELEDGTLSTYEVKPGRAYSMFLEERERRREQARRDYETASTERKRQRAVIDELRTHGSHNYSGVRSREKALERIDPVAAPPKEARRIGVDLSPARRATKGFAIEFNDLSKAFGRTLFGSFSGTIRRGEHVAIVGPNGAGKTTLLRILSGELPPDRGSVRYGTGLAMASYSQRTVDDLPAGATAFEAVVQLGVTPELARALLGRLNLGGASGDKLVENFSGGERRRIMLARLMAQRADCLFLDEPTNDLDIAGREAVEDVLADYGGALLVVSHDRYLLKRLAKRVIAIGDGSAALLDGDYETFERRAHEQNLAPERERSAQAVAGERRRESAHEAKLEAGRRTRAVEAAERRVADLDRQRAEIELLFTQPELYDDPATIVELQRDLERVRAESERAFEAWETAVRAAEQPVTGG